MGPVPFFVGPVPFFSRGLVTLRGCVRPSVYVRMYVCMSPILFQHFVSGFGISAPAQLQVTNAVVYTVPPMPLPTTLLPLPNPHDLYRAVYPALLVMCKRLFKRICPSVGPSVPQPNFVM